MPIELMENIIRKVSAPYTLASVMILLKPSKKKGDSTNKM